MPVPLDPKLTDERLVDYLLGRLSDEDAAPLDELSIADEEFAWRLRAVENDLVDVYVRGGLDAATRERFKTFYLASPRRRDKVTFAEGFGGAVDRAGARPSASEAMDDAPRSSVAGRRSPPYWWLATAAAIAAIAFSALFLQHREFRQELADAQQRTAALDQRTRELEQKLAERPAVAVDSTVAPSSSRGTMTAVTSLAAAETPTTAAIELSPETRAPGSIAVKLPPENTRAAFDLRLESNDFRRYQATLKDPGTDRVLWQSQWMAPTTRHDTSMVSIALPAHVLKTQHYTLELAGQTAAGRVDLAGSYVFEVVPR
jgi:hypothetical protein